MKRQRAAPKSLPAKRRKTTGQFKSQARLTRSVITERKYFDAEVNNTTIATSASTWAGAEIDPAALCLFAPITGDDISNRTGRKVQVLSIKVRGFFDVSNQTNATDADKAYVGRIILVQDKQTNAAQLNAEDVITSGAANVAVMMYQNPAFFGRFKILKEFYWEMQSPTLTYDGTNIEQSGLIKHFSLNHKFIKPMVVHYNGTNGGTVADVVDNSFHIIALTNNANLLTTVNYKVRTTFIDV